MKNLILSLFLSIVSFFSYSQGPNACACVWSDNQGNLQCVFGNCGQYYGFCANQVSTPNLQQTGNCPIPVSLNCNPYTWYMAGGACWYQGAGCSGSAVCNYIISLPVELVEFKVVFEDGVNVLTWTTASEHNSSHFNLLHTLDGENYQLVAILPSSINSTSIINYEAKHLDYPHKINYYLLEQVDLDGNSKQYGPISVDNRPNNERAVRTINVLGQEVGAEYKGLVVRVFDDLTTEMVLQ